jgi:23S rRNA (pseudouridine1915-N3)-methyltransferase
MQLTLAHIGPKQGKPGAKSGYESLTRLYLDRTSPYHPIQSEAFRSEADFLDWLAKQRGRNPAIPILLDSRGKQLSSTELAQWLGLRRDHGAQHLVFAIGPADGWSDSTRALIQSQSGQALLLSFGPITMPHELARLVLAEQLYRACTILAGHPYHSGHEHK